MAVVRLGAALGGVIDAARHAFAMLVLIVKRARSPLAISSSSRMRSIKAMSATFRPRPSLKRVP
jgi:hypothetical protein